MFNKQGCDPHGVNMAMVQLAERGMPVTDGDSDSTASGVVITRPLDRPAAVWVGTGAGLELLEEPSAAGPAQLLT